MAIEPRRGCGYRKVGGLYMMGGKLGMPCCKMPIPLHVCPTCNQGVKQSRGWQWIDPKPWVKMDQPCTQIGGGLCPLNNIAVLGDRVGLMWIGTGFYKTPEDFIREADTLGISKRIKSIPQGFELGKTWVFLAHPHAIRKVGEIPPGCETPLVTMEPGIFRIFLPTALEKIVTETQAQDAEEMEKLEKRGITPVVVPDDDKDHQGSVYDKPATEKVENEQLGLNLPAGA